MNPSSDEPQIPDGQADTGQPSAVPAGHSHPDPTASQVGPSDATVSPGEPPQSHDDDELPEEEPLTPELVEEEAIRGDFMLRWAVVFLALLFGFSRLSDTRTLVHIRSGEQMRAAGGLPSGIDTMSFSADGRPWANVSWMFDHLMNFIWSVSQDNGLTLFKAFVAVIVAFQLVHISVPGMPTWWNSICAVAAVVACSGDFAAQTELATLVGMVLLLRMLHQHRDGTANGLTWKIPVLIAVWCNFDSRAWIGALCAVLYAIGNTVGRREVRGEDDRVGGSADDARPLQGFWRAAILGVLALLVNPFPLNSLLSPATVYSVEYPAMQEQRPLKSALAAVSFDGRVDYFPMWEPDTFLLFDHTQISGLAIVLVAVIILVMARDRRDLGLAAVLAGLFFLSLLATHELAVTALTAAVIAGTCAQRWYRRNYSLQYSIEPRELLFSRGGRALTVFALAFLGFCVVAGRLPGNTPVGIGFDRETRITIDTLGPQLAELKDDARILHTRIDQGDILIWHGRRSMVDSRLLPFGRMSDPDSVFARHRQMLASLFLRPADPGPDRNPPVNSGQEDPEAAKERAQREEARRKALEWVSEFSITHAMPRLAPPGAPDYRSLQSLSSGGEWVLISVGASAAILEKVDPLMAPEDREALFPKFQELAFRNAQPVPLGRVDFAREPDFYQRYVYRARPARDENLRRADHYLWLAARPVDSGRQALDSLSLTTLALRELNASLFNEPQNSEAYRMLGGVYEQIGQLESLLSGQSASDSSRQEMRYLQSVMAYRQALRQSPEDPMVWERLYRQYLSRQKQDLALECLDHLLPLLEARLDLEQNDEAIKQMVDVQQQLLDSQQKLQETVQQSQKQLEEFLAKQEPVDDSADDPAAGASQTISIVSDLLAGGLDREALKILQERTDQVEQNPIAKIVLGRLLLETGDVETGAGILAQIGVVAREQPAAFAASRWHFPVAVSRLAVADQAGAVEYWTAQLSGLDQAATAPEPYRAALLTLPLSPEMTLMPTALLSAWPLTHLNTMKVPLQGIPHARADARMLIALALIEEGNVASARQILRSIVSECGLSPYRGLASYYLSMMEQDVSGFLEQHLLDDWEEFEFSSEAKPANSAAPPGPAAPAAPEKP